MLEELRRTPLPIRMRHLKHDARGYPVPWFVKWYGDKPDFRVIGEGKVARAMHSRLCWICGQELGAFMTFVIGGMCAVTRTSAEPPAHLECGRYAARVCPFLTRPYMHRQAKDLEAGLTAPGIANPRNPGVACLWTTRAYTTFRAHAGNGGVLFTMGEPIETQWFREGRTATGDEVWNSIETGLPILIDAAHRDSDIPASLAHLERAVIGVQRLTPMRAESNRALATWERSLATYRADPASFACM